MRPGILVVALGLCVLGAAPAAAQGGPNRTLEVAGRRDLDFGTMIAGVSTTIGTTAGGFFLVTGIKGTEVQIQLTLPTALDGPGGSAPLTFRSTDGAHGGSPATGSATVFDPSLPITVVLSNSGRYYVWLGGTVSPPTQLSGGTYTATIALTATYTGN